jgi:UDP-2,3-diacylglucosamine pyrophosphatase LpxH
VKPDFTRAEHTFVISDLHLCDAEKPHPYNPLWKRFKRRELFVDSVVKDFVRQVMSRVPGEKELVLNGDIFDFDSVMKIPSSEEQSSHGVALSWIERLRGMHSEEPKSRLKLKYILDDHPVFLEALREWVQAGNRVILVIGNHDIEFHWTSVKNDFIERLGLTEEQQERVRICEWFYLSNGDTLIEHGNQYDAYTICSNPINPLIRKGFRAHVRIPFGNIAGRYIMNGIGLMNPHAPSSFIKSTFKEYLVFYFRYVVRVQPLLMFTYVWSSMVTLIDAIADGLLPAMTDPLTLEGRVRDIATKSNSNPAIVLGLREMHVHPAIYNPFKIMRELWLDRVLLLFLVFLVSFEVFIHGRFLLTDASLWWLVLPLGLLTPFFIFYARSVDTELYATERAAFEAVPLSARIAGVERVVQGHSHLEKHAWKNGVEYLNTGTWSYAFHDVECTQPYGRKCFAWIKPHPGLEFAERKPDPTARIERVAELYEWRGGGDEPLLVGASDP